MTKRKNEVNCDDNDGDDDDDKETICDTII